MTLEWITTLGAFLAGGLLLAFAVWREGRPKRIGARKGLMSWHLVMLLAGMVIMLAAVHGVNLMGIRTGGGAPQS